MANGDGAAAIRGILWTGHDEACVFSKLYQQLGLADALFSNTFNTNLVNDTEAGARGVERGYGGRTMQKSPNVRRIPEISLESERLFVGHPAGCLRLEEHTSELQSPCNLVCRL